MKKKPRLKCARWCGRGCTRAEYDAARALSRRIAGALGPDWEPVTSENMGWFARARAAGGAVSIHANPGASRAVRYTAYVDGRYVESAGTPARAVAAAIARLGDAASRMERLISTLIGALSGAAGDPS